MILYQQSTLINMVNDDFCLFLNTCVKIMNTFCPSILQNLINKLICQQAVQNIGKYSN